MQIHYSTITSFCHIRSRNTQNIPAYYSVDQRITLFLDEDEKAKTTRPDEPNFDLFTAFELDFLSFLDHFIQSNKATSIYYLFYHADEARTGCMKNEKVAAVYPLANNIDA